MTHNAQIDRKTEIKRLNFVRFFAPMCIATALIVPQEARSATLDIRALATTTGGDPGLGDDGTSFQTNDLTATASASATSRATPSTGSATASASASINGATGQLRFGLNGSSSARNCVTNESGDPPPEFITSCDATYSADALTRLTEPITVTGTGEVSVFMDVDASWSSPGWGFVAETTVSSLDAFNQDTATFSKTQVDLGMSSSLDTVLSASINLLNAAEEEIFLSWRLSGDIVSTNSFTGAAPAEVIGFMDASNTANIFYTVTDGLTVTGQTAGLLSNPAFDTNLLAPIPLPAGLPLLTIAMLGLFATVGKRQRNMAQ